MKILRLDLSAFGPFTDVVLNLSEGREGLHVIYGPNEAGKSSALRALRQMLYGIDERTPDNFLHSYPRLKVGGALRRSDGSILEFVRRKRRGKSLMMPDESEFIEDSRVWAFLGSVDKEMFKNRFGINHDRLVRGGKEILRGGGDIGQILFAGGLGIGDLRKIQSDLLNEAGKYFKPSGKNSGSTNRSQPSKRNRRRYTKPSSLHRNGSSIAARMMRLPDKKRVLRPHLKKDSGSGTILSGSGKHCRPSAGERNC